MSETPAAETPATQAPDAVTPAAAEEPAAATAAPAAAPESTAPPSAPAAASESEAPPPAPQEPAVEIFGKAMVQLPLENMPQMLEKLYLSLVLRTVPHPQIENVNVLLVSHPRIGSEDDKDRHPSGSTSFVNTCLTQVLPTEKGQAVQGKQRIKNTTRSQAIPLRTKCNEQEYLMHMCLFDQPTPALGEQADETTIMDILANGISSGGQNPSNDLGKAIHVVVFVTNVNASSAQLDYFQAWSKAARSKSLPTFVAITHCDTLEGISLEPSKIYQSKHLKARMDYFRTKMATDCVFPVINYTNTSSRNMRNKRCDMVDLLVRILLYQMQEQALTHHDYMAKEQATANCDLLSFAVSDALVSQLTSQFPHCNGVEVQMALEDSSWDPRAAGELLRNGRYERPEAQPPYIPMPVPDVFAAREYQISDECQSPDEVRVMIENSARWTVPFLQDQVKTANIMLIGTPGAGKSSTINNLTAQGFEGVLLDHARTGSVESSTYTTKLQEINPVCSTGTLHYRFWDTRGAETSEGHSLYTRQTARSILLGHCRHGYEIQAGGDVEFDQPLTRKHPTFGDRMHLLCVVVGSGEMYDQDLPLLTLWVEEAERLDIPVMVIVTKTDREFPDSLTMHDDDRFKEQENHLRHQLRVEDFCYVQNFTTEDKLAGPWARRGDNWKKDRLAAIAIQEMLDLISVGLETLEQQFERQRPSEVTASIERELVQYVIKQLSDQNVNTVSEETVKAMLLSWEFDPAATLTQLRRQLADSGTFPEPVAIPATRNRQSHRRSQEDEYDLI